MTALAVPDPRIGRRHGSSAADGSLAEHLERVDALLAATLDELDAMWSKHPGGYDRLAILGDERPPDLLRALLDGGGKRIRPTMAYLGWRAGCGETNDPGSLPAVVRAGAALELLHVFALVHDDVMDESATRRGRPTVHERARRRHTEHDAVGDAVRFGDSVAILVGDLAHAEADALAAGLPGRMSLIWRRLTVELTYGQLLDVVGTAAGTHDVPYSRTAAQLKSGRYTVERPLELGAAAANAGPRVRAALADYGREIGLAFALRDDILGAWGDPLTTGKPAGDDLLSGKPTMLLTLAHQRMGSARDRALLRRVGTGALGPAGVLALQDRMHATGVAGEIEALIAGHVSAALAALDADEVDAGAAEHLARLAQQIAWRDR